MRRTLAVLTGSVLALAACGGGGDEPAGSGDPVVDGHFVTAVAGDPGNLDPHMTVLALTRYVASYLYDQLIYQDEQGESRPWLAQSWQVDVDSVTYTLREGITCADGTPLTASDVAANIDFVGDPANESPLLGVSVPPGVATTADDAARTVTVTTGAPDPFLLYGTGSLAIVCPAGMADRSTLAQGGDGTGMFVLTEVAPDERYTFERRDDYAWGPDGAAATDAGTPATVTVRVVPNESTAANLFLAGELDLVQVSGIDQERLEAQGYAQYDTRALFAELLFNQAEDRPGADPRVRLALTQAVDWDEVGMVMTGGRGAPSRRLGVLDPYVCAADTVTGSRPSPDPQAAAAMLDQAGWLVGADGVRSRDGERLATTLVYPTERGDQLGAGMELVAQLWGELGVEVELRGLSSVQANEVLFGTGAWEATVLSLNVAFPSQFLPFYSGPTPPDGVNFAGIDNPDYSAAIAAAMQHPAADGCADWQEAERALVAAQDTTPIVDDVLRYYADGVELRLNAGNPAPPTVRLFH